jgi:uncharacterized protein YdiU (UPF0061 family)
MSINSNIAKGLAFNFDNSYTQLPEGLFAKVMPQAALKPSIALFNHAYAASIGLDTTKIDEEELAGIFSGTKIFENAEPIAQAYAGHQFGHFNMLGDGRAILLGEHITPNNTRLDIQLKGSGQTPYSRRGDGKASLSAMLREYIISEAMYALGVPTSRSLAVIKTGETIYRDGMQEGAVLTRVASSHIRVGSFEYVSRFHSKEILEQFTQYVIKRHYPEIVGNDDYALTFLKAVATKQVSLIVHWLRVGFIHGVMNTDNMSIPGETIDYGPCAFMNRYNPATVFSSIDTNGRYAFGNQAAIAQWNLACLASSLLPLIDENEEKAVALAQEVIDGFAADYKLAWYQMMKNKLGLLDEQPGDKELIESFLFWMKENKADYTNSFLALISSVPNSIDVVYDTDSFKQWRLNWQQRIGNANAKSFALMQSVNPLVIPRNHLVEDALAAATIANNYTKVEDFLAVLSNPYTTKEGLDYFQLPPSERVCSSYQTFCGT